ncbi:MAG TPA: SDR family NAD(P)-dependent oxidoreductase [Bryobacterales bacterium]|nr:SDR family NAD(P)-dependent oxidoreductase [Bryobacterales bacterium]
MNVADPGSVGKAFSGIAALDILVNNAGIGHVGGIEETSLEDWQRLFTLTSTASSWSPSKRCRCCWLPSTAGS